MQIPRPPDVWHTLLEVARWAPSPHNIQPWRVAIRSETEAILCYDADRLIPDTDTTGQFTTIGFGIFLEYLRIAASHRGLMLGWAPLREGLDRGVTATTPLFRLTLAEGGEPDEFPVEAITLRRTSRLPYKGERPVSADCLRALGEIAGQFGQSFQARQDADFVRSILLLNRDTLFYDMDDDVARTEVGRWIRFSQAEAAARRDGLAAHCMRMPGWLMRVFFRRHEILNFFLIKPIVQWYYVFAMRGTTTVAWIAGPVGNQAEWVEAGRMMGRWWLRMSQEGVYLHPFGSIITNKTAYARLRDKLAGDTRTRSDVPVWMIVRMGHSDDPPASQRRTVREILCEEAKAMP